MDATLRGLIALLGGTDVEARCAALVVLTHLRAADAPVVRAVGTALGARNAVVRDFAVAYFEQVHPADGLPHILPLLDSEDDALRERAVAMAAAHGHAALSAARKLLPGAPRRRLNAVIGLAARLRSAGALDLLYQLMAGDDFDANRTACDAVLSLLPPADARLRADLFARGTALVTAAKDHRSALVAAAKLFGGLGDPRARRLLLPLLDAAQPPAVRTHALGALAQCLRGQRLTAAEVTALMPLLDEDDETGILRPAVQLLEEQSLARSYLPQLSRLADSPQPLVKRFAVQQLGGFESEGVVKTLIGYLTDDSYTRRDQAASSLKKLAAARPALMKALLACTDERQSWTLADVLLAHDRSWKRDTVEALWNRLADAVEKRDDRLYSAFFHFLNAIDPEGLATRLRAHAGRLEKAKRFGLAAKWLALLKDTAAFDAETRFALAMAELKSRPRAGLTAGRHSPVLEPLRELARTSFPLLERLRKDRTLLPDQLLSIAFHLAEGAAEERTVAVDLLTQLAARQGRTKAGKAAKNKLRLLRH